MRFDLVWLGGGSGLPARFDSGTRWRRALVGREGFGFGEVVGGGAVEKGQPREAARANHLLPSRVAVGAVCVSWPCARCLNMNPVFRRWVRTARSVSQGGRVRAQLLASSLAPSRALWLVPSWEALRAGTAMGVGIIHGHRSWSTARCGGSCVEAIRPTVWVDREIRMCCWWLFGTKAGWCIVGNSDGYAIPKALLLFRLISIKVT
jgi:hypothetical protein